MCADLVFLSLEREVMREPGRFRVQAAWVRHWYVTLVLLLGDHRLPVRHVTCDMSQLVQPRPLRPAGLRANLPHAHHDASSPSIRAIERVGRHWHISPIPSHPLSP